MAHQGPNRDAKRKEIKIRTVDQAKVKAFTDFLQSIGLTFALYVLAWTKLSGKDHNVLLIAAAILAAANGVTSAMAYLMTWDFWKRHVKWAMVIGLVVVIVIASVIMYLPKDVIS